jgi:hypothetical protein
MSDDAVTADARLMILTELAQQTDGRSNDLVLARVIEAMGFRRTREWVRTQLNALAELGAIRVADVASVRVATLLRLGRDHVERRAIIEGVSRPADEA